MILVIAPAIDGLRREWREAAVEPRRQAVAVLAVRRHPGADAVDPRRRHPALRQRVRRLRDRVQPHLRGRCNIVPILIGAYYTGNVLDNPHLAQALAFGMFVVLAVMMLLYIPLQRRAARWAK